MNCPECNNKDTECIDTDTDWGGCDVEMWQCNKCDCTWEIDTRLTITEHGKLWGVEDETNEVSEVSERN